MPTSDSWEAVCSPVAVAAVHAGSKYRRVARTECSVERGIVDASAPQDGRVTLREMGMAVERTVVMTSGGDRFQAFLPLAVERGGKTNDSDRFLHRKLPPFDVHLMPGLTFGVRF